MPGSVKDRGRPSESGRTSRWSRYLLRERGNDAGAKTWSRGEDCWRQERLAKTFSALANATPVYSKLHSNGEVVVEERRTHEEEKHQKGEVSKDTSSTAWLVWCILGTAHRQR